jgi:hypothetical protein
LSFCFILTHARVAFLTRRLFGCKSYLNVLNQIISVLFRFYITI